MFGSAIALGAAIFACNSIAELNLQYSPGSPATPDGAPPPDGTEPSDGGPKVRDSSFEAQVQPPPNEFDAAPLGLCEGGITDPESICDHTAGLGCCIRSTAATSECVHQLDFETHCLATGDSVFVACVRSVDGSECCWRKDPKTNRNFAVYSNSCSALGVPMVCSETADCPLGQTCNFPSTPCHPDITIGLCGSNGEVPACPL